MFEVTIATLQPERLAEVLAPDRAAAFAAMAGQAAETLRGRTVWNVNSTASGGGVAEMLKQLVGYSEGAGVRCRWLVMEGDPPFFAVTKRVHNLVHGQPGDGGPLGEAERETYERVPASQADELRGRISPGDLVIIHDPQPLPMVRVAHQVGAGVVWRCHVGTDTTNVWSERGWGFLRPYLDHADVQIYSRRSYAPDWVPQERIVVIPPAIDPWAPKNAPLSPESARAILAHIGVLREAGPGSGGLEFEREDRSPAVVTRTAEVIGGRPRPADPMVVQVSRWDRLKDMQGVLQGFVSHVADEPGMQRGHLALVGPATAGVADDPEGAEVYQQCVQTWQSLPDGLRERVSLVSLPMDDVEENAVMVNAIQRHATVVTQKSLVEGFGLTVAEAMWKVRPVVASRVGGITDQITEGSGVLLDDPTDLPAFGAALRDLLGDPTAARRIGEAAQERVRDRFLPDRQLTQWSSVLASLVRP